MSIMTRFTVKVLALVVAGAAVAAGVAHADTIVYNNSTNYLGTFLNAGALSAAGDEFGDQITLDPNTTQRWLTQLSVDYYCSGSRSGDEKAEIRIYANDGAETIAGSGIRVPKTLLFDSGTPDSLVSGFNQFVISGQYFHVPDSFTWTVQFTGITGTETNGIGLLLGDPPQVGSSYSDYWEKVGTTWTLKTVSGTPINFSAQVLAVVPEPTTLSFGLLAGLMGMGYWGYRRAQKRS